MTENARLDNVGLNNDGPDIDARVFDTYPRLFLLTLNAVCYAWQKADMAAAPTLITDARRQVVDFTIPFMTTQATLLLRRPPPGTELRVKDLADLVAQSEIKYGTLRKGFIPRNFRSTNDTLLTIVWRNMRRSVTATVYRGSLGSLKVLEIYMWNSSKSLPR